MRVGAMLSDVLESLVRAPVTERYPFVKRPAPERLRGQVVWDPAKCSGCGLCAMDCPAEAIELTVVDKAAKKFIFRYHVDRCTFCAQCRVSCRQGCIELSSVEWELAALGRRSYTLEFGVGDDAEAVVAGGAVDHDPVSAPA